MEISILDFVLINSLSYLMGVATGLIVCCKNKDKLLVKSRSHDNISMYTQRQSENSSNFNEDNTVIAATPAIASAPPSSQVQDNKQLRITLE